MNTLQMQFAWVVEGLVQGIEDGGTCRLAGEALKGIPEPIMRKGGQQYTELKRALCVVVVRSDSRESVALAGEQDKPIVEEDLDLTFGDKADAVKSYPSFLNA